MSLKDASERKLINDAIAQAAFLLDSMGQNARAGQVTVQFNRSAERVASVVITSSETIKV